MILGETTLSEHQSLCVQQSTPMFDAERPPFFRGLRSLLGSLFIDSKTSLFWGEMRWNSFEWMGMGEWDDYW